MTTIQTSSDSRRSFARASVSAAGLVLVGCASTSKAAAEGLATFTP
jgi:hypothetical protein